MKLKQKISLEKAERDENRLYEQIADEYITNMLGIMNKQHEEAR